MKVKSDLSNRMVLYRARERISQAELARRAGVTVQTVNAVENGTQHPSRLTEAKLRLVVGENDNQYQQD